MTDRQRSCRPAPKLSGTGRREGGCLDVSCCCCCCCVLGWLIVSVIVDAIVKKLVPAQGRGNRTERDCRDGCDCTGPFLARMMVLGLAVRLVGLADGSWCWVDWG